MKKVGACVLMATVAMGNTAEKEKSTLEINWKNSKGETKTFKVNDIEKEFDPEQIKSKTFIQGNLLPIGFSELQGKGGSYCRGRKASCSVGSFKKASCSRSGSFKKASCSVSRGKSSCSYSKGKVCGKGYSKGKGCGRGYSKGSVCSYGSGANLCGKKKFSRGYSKGSVCSYKSNVCSVSRSKSRSVCGKKKTFVVHHRPQYVIKKKFFPRKKQNKLHKFNKYNKSAEKCSESVEKYNKDYDNQEKKISVSDLEKILKLNKNKKSDSNFEKRSASRLRKSNQVSKYLKDQDSKFLKKNNEREAEASNKNSFKNAVKRAQNKKKENEKERQSSCEAQKRHNLVNLNHKSEEALLMKEQDKDNLHCNDKVIEEFDKLEHFKKVEERCRSASKCRHANVKKHQDMDKCQAQNAMEKTKEKRGRNKLRSNFNKNSDKFCNLDKNSENNESKYLKDDKECSANAHKERSLSTKSCKSTFQGGERKLHENDASCYDLKNIKNQKCMDSKKVCENDDVNKYSKDKSYCKDNENRCEDTDKAFNDNDCNDGDFCDVC